MHKKTALGRLGEQAVMAYLVRNHFRILAHNVIRPFGEIDIIACKKDVLAFVEVKTRKNNDTVPFEALIVQSKKRRIIAVAKEYMVRNAIENMVCRFDVAFVHGIGEHAQINYIENAFQEQAW